MTEKKRKPPQPTSAEELADRLGLQIPPQIDISRFPEWLLRAAKKAIEEAFEQDYWDDIAGTTADDIADTIKAAIEQGMSMRDVAKELEARLGDEYPRARGLRIARTETCNAMNTGHMSAIKQVQDETGITMNKEWLSVLSSTTRDWHADADGQEVGVDENFVVMGEETPYPGHWSMSPENRINCLCSLLSAPVEESLPEEEEEE